MYLEIYLQNRSSRPRAASPLSSQSLSCERTLLSTISISSQSHNFPDSQANYSLHFEIDWNNIY
ncbi:hypothetical protein K469DRAFT_700232 [Zopfia rhizophila CBS 207.26]|uniref:Uncharacterized protein n=1 Tax=Zopfia rhizophila CBS 207.26 TaxID=1314779 RepID=A0A6A6DF79_9PEZI|nr:hypothetical protein K469DRAFT_700232 [Zopfia rhizophila CBS 207.26]